jgi:hypothetical protein
MGRKGRPQKPGKRTKGNRPEPDRSFDRGTDRVQAMRARWGEHYNTALGRAFVSGLLGEGQQANDRYAEAKRFLRLYTRLIDQDRYRCALDRTPRGNLAVAMDLDQIEWEHEQQEWLFAAMAKLDATGGRPFFDQLLSKLHTDHGPPWVDRLIDGGRDPSDFAVLKAALVALDAIVPNRVVRIVSS